MFKSTYYDLNKVRSHEPYGKMDTKKGMAKKDKAKKDKAKKDKAKKGGDEELDGIMDQVDTLRRYIEYLRELVPTKESDTSPPKM
ncbi:hypothetical protein BG011_002436 [Mortierella polycephala]|uniref:Uncharacterized protein n=1 Tax=Mortierella polycephala TaxID=41804 RepID=A0A9P6Q390_9FUNG|nr:hypothetical protein BG011_002436 [Mortierella polycephala]